ncbi:MATE family efflux transporter [soil metagenome]
MGAYRTELGATARLAAPLAVAQLAQMATAFVDVMMIGRLGSQSMAAAVLGSSIFSTLLLVCLGVVIAVNPSVAQAHGAGDSAGVSRWARQGIWLAAGLGAILFVLLSFIEPFLLTMRQESETAALAAGYVLAIRWGLVPNLMYGALRGLAEGLSRPKAILAISVVAIGLNAGLNYILIYGKLGFPAMGLVGCGWASAIVHLCMFIAMAIYVRRSTFLRKYQVLRRVGRPDFGAIRELARLGWPIGIAFGLEAGLFSAATLLIGTLSTEALAAHQIALNASGMTFMIPLGVAMAATVRVGQAVGRRDAAGVSIAGWVAIGIGTAVMLIPAMLFWLRPEWVVWLYMGTTGGDPQVLAAAASLLGVAAVFQLFDGAQVTAGGVLRGLKDTRATMFIGAIAYWGIGMTAAYLLGIRGPYGAAGVWWGLTGGLAAASILLAVRFRWRVRGRQFSGANDPPEMRSSITTGARAPGPGTPPLASQSLGSGSQQVD